jgi:adenine specific DNA methylase Mod
MKKKHIRQQTKIELVWEGKENRSESEPRILLEDSQKSYHAERRVTDNDIFDNRLIFGDNLHNEGGVEFPKGKKPEALIKRCFDLATKPGDIVLDSFAGSGTTGAVAHKMGRRWLMVELGEHCHTHVIPRMKTIISGDDQSGISKAVGWQGGGGFRYYRLSKA